METDQPDTVFRMIDPEPTSITFQVQGEELVRFGQEGLWVKPGYDVDELAQEFLDAVQGKWEAQF